MERLVCVLSIIISSVYSFIYASIGGFQGNKSALSKIGLYHPVLFIIWGLLTLFALSFNIYYGFKNTKYKFYKYLLIISALGMMMTVFFDFDYDLKVQYYIHCIGSMTFSVINGVNVFLLFLLNQRKILTGICAVILVFDFILLLIYKETAFIELFPIISGYVLLIIHNMTKESKKNEALQHAEKN